MVVPAPRVLPDHLAAEHDKDPVADPQVVDLVRDDENTGTADSGLVDDAQQRLLGAHVHTGGRTQEYQDPRLAGQRPGHHDLLLVSPGQAGYQLARAVGLDVEVGDELLGEDPLPRRRHPSEAPGPVRDRHGGVLADRQGRYEPFPVPVAGHEPDAGGEGGRDAARAYRPAVHLDRAALAGP